ncbi:uncharacterized protein [Excalfactoria chinensis]|uniref:uncharacterized protein isoform X6 n=2 Tax=Excalfactoria chinensis TaxID=46218 RepID=UPI003B3B3E46
MLHPWRCARPGWMELSTARLCGWHLCPRQWGWGSKFFTVPSKPSHCMILHVYDASSSPTQPRCSASQEQQPAGSRHPESQSDDELGAPFPDDPLDPNFMPVPGGQPRGPAGESAEENPAYDPEGDAGDVTRGGDPGYPLISRTETLSDGAEVPPVWALPGHPFPPALEPSWNPSSREREEDEAKRGKHSQGSSRLLKQLLKEMKKAERGTDQETEQGARQEGGYPTLPVPDRGAQAAATTGMPGMNAGESTKAGAHRPGRKRHVPVMVSAVLLPVLVLAVGAVIWLCRNYLVRKREKRAAEEEAPPDSNEEMVPTGDESWERQQDSCPIEQESQQ